MTRLVVDARMVGNSGIGTYLRQVLPRALPRLHAHRPAVLCARAHREELTALVGRSADFVVWNVPPLSPADLWSVPPVAGRDDLVWTPHFNVPLRGRQALAVTLHDLLPLTMPALAGRGRSLPARAWLRAIGRRARIVLCVSRFTRGEALRLGQLDPDRVRVTPLGVDAAWSAAYPRPPASDAAPTMIYVGLLKPHKNVHRLLRAFASVRERIAHRLVLIARHHDIRNVDRRALALARSLGDRVELVESVPFPDLVARVHAAQFAVQPSLHEGFGLPALEAMAAGTPVLAGRAGALPEVCGDAALFCDPLSESDIACALLRLAGDTALRAQLSERGRA
ncbi:MAG: glycosyltransferase family 4 protein, partial [Burkholderiales bacterium]|nr:glycosyltransferase family 4 protein [Burkholderiales bacterium]